MVGYSVGSCVGGVGMCVGEIVGGGVGIEVCCVGMSVSDVGAEVGLDKG